MVAVLAGATAVAAAAVIGLVCTHREVVRRVLLGTVDPRPLALFRIALGLSLLGLVLETAPLSTYLFSDEGLLPSAAVPQVYGGPARYGDDLVRYVAGGRWSLLHFRDDPAFVHAHVAGLVVVSVGLVIGCYTRTCAVLAWFLLASLLRRGDAHWGGEQTFTSFLFVLMFARSGAAYSVDAWRRGGPLYPRVPVWPQALLLAQLGLIYAVNGWTKSGPTWTSGETLGLAVHLDRYARLDWHGLAVALGPWPFRLATWGVMWWERLFPLMLVGLWLRAAARCGAQPLQGAARVTSRICWLVLAGAFATWAIVPGALGEDPVSPVAGVRAWSSGLAALTISAVVVLGPRLRGLGRLRWLLAPQLWLGFGVVFHAVSLVLFELGAFVSATMAAYVLCGIGPMCVGWVQRLTRALARLRIPIPEHLRRTVPLPEEPPVHDFEHDPAALPGWAWWVGGMVVLGGGVLALLPATQAMAWWHGAWFVTGLVVVSAGWRAARRASVSADPRRTRAWAYGPAGRLAAGGVLAHHLVALVVWQTPRWPSVPWRNDARALVEPWIELSFTRQLWSMFAPNGPRRNQTVRTKIVDSQGIVHDLRTELEHPERLRRPYLVHDRWRKIDEAMSGHRAWLAPWHARYLCRHWALEHGGEPPTEVVLERVVAPFPPLRPLDTQAYFWDHAEVRPIVRVRCAEEPFAQLSAEVRERYGLPPASPESLVYAEAPPRYAPIPMAPLWAGMALVLAGALSIWSRGGGSSRRCDRGAVGGRKRDDRS